MKDSNPAEPFDWSKFPWGRWRKEMETAKAGVDTIAAMVSRRLSENGPSEGAARSRADEDRS